jgi:hypothetical protein
MRWIECRGGPHDGRRLEVVDNAYMIDLPMQAHREHLTYTEHSSIPPIFFKGRYRQDPRNREMFIWMGDK